MESYRQAVQEQVSRFLLSCRRYKRALLILIILIIGSIVWGAYQEPIEEEHHLPTPTTSSQQRGDRSGPASFDTSESDKSVGDIVYDISPNLRPHPWQEVVSGETNLLDAMSHIDDKNELLEGHSPTAEYMSDMVSHETMNAHTKLTSRQQSQGNSKKHSVTHSNKSRTSNTSKDIEDLERSEIANIRLLGIIDGPTSYAIISIGQESKTMKTGDVWKSVRLMSIKENGMYVERGGTSIWIGLEN